jgi:hypothetical protein
MKRFRTISRTKKIVAVGATLALTLGIAGAAFAYFTANGSGTGTAYVGSPAPWTVAVHLDAGSNGVFLYPGTGVETLDFTVTNGSGGPQVLNLVTAAPTNDGSGLVQSGSPLADIGGCYASWFPVTFNGALYLNGNGSTPYTYGHAIPAGQYVWGQVTVSMTDSGTNQDVCAGLTPSITVKAS